MSIQFINDCEKKINYNHIIISFHKGHLNNLDQTANIEKNPYWIVQNKHTNKKYILMYCNDDIFTKIDIETIDIIKAINASFYLADVGYILYNIKNKNKIESNYLHAFLTNHFGNGIGQESVDHINRQKLDNRSCNLRIVNQAEQNRNRSKRSDAKLYGTIKLPRYVSFYEFEQNGQENIYFYIDSHPRIESSKSGKKYIRGSKSLIISNDTKLEQILEINKKLNNGIDSQEYDFFDPNKFYQEEFEREFTYDEYMKNIHLMSFSPQYDDLTPEIEELYKKYVKKDLITIIKNKDNEEESEELEEKEKQLKKEQLEKEKIEKEKIEKEEAHKEFIKEIYKQKSENMKGEKNHNYGKEKSIETKHKMAISHKKNKQSISDEIILQVREDLEKGLRNVDIEEKYNLSRDHVYKIKKGTICTSEELTSIEYYENIKNKKCMNKEEQAISKRKVTSDEIYFILEEFLKKKSKTSKDDGPKAILEKVNKKREESNNNNKVTLDSIKNVIDNKTVIYQCEVIEEKYTYYQELIQKVNDFKK